MTRIIMGVAALLATTALAQADTLRFAYAQNATPTVEAMQKFAELVKDKTGGDVTVQFFPDGQLGGERELVEMVKGGLLDMTKVSSGLMESFAPIYGVFSMPYVFDNEAHFYRAMDDGEVMDPVYQATANQGFVGLTYYNSGARSFYMKDGPVQSVADLAGKKIRVMQSPTSIAMMQMLGAAPIAMGQAEVYTSIQQDVLDGAENNEYALTIARHGEVAKFYTYDEHTRIPDVVLISSAALKRLSEDNRAAVIDAAKESTEYHKQVWGAAIDAEKAKAEEMGVQFFKTDVSQFQAAVAPMYDALKVEPEKQALFDAIRAEAEQ